MAPVNGSMVCEDVACATCYEGKSDCSTKRLGVWVDMYGYWIILLLTAIAKECDVGYNLGLSEMH